MAATMNPPCPFCGATKTGDRKITIVVSGLAIVIISIISLSLLLPVVSLLFGIGMVVFGNMIPVNRRYKCKSCKNKFGEEEEEESVE